MEWYLLKSAACLCVFYVFYKVLLENSSIHAFKRVYLLVGLVLSFLIPLFTFTTYVEIPMVETPLATAVLSSEFSAVSSEEKINSALESLKDNKVGLMVLKSLIKANSLQNGISLKGLKFSNIEIEVGLIPNVRLIFS